MSARGPDPAQPLGTDASSADREALVRTHGWFEVNSGWAPPDPETLQDWADEGIARAPDDCWVGNDGRCPHGLAAWPLVLAATEAPDPAP